MVSIWRLDTWESTGMRSHSVHCSCAVGASVVTPSYLFVVIPGYVPMYLCSVLSHPTQTYVTILTPPCEAKLHHPGSFPTVELPDRTGIRSHSAHAQWPPQPLPHRSGFISSVLNNIQFNPIWRQLWVKESMKWIILQQQNMGQFIQKVVRM